VHLESTYKGSELEILDEMTPVMNEIAAIPARKNPAIQPIEPVRSR